VRQRELAKEKKKGTDIERERARESTRQKESESEIESERDIVTLCLDELKGKVDTMSRWSDRERVARA